MTSDIPPNPGSSDGSSDSEQTTPAYPSYSAYADSERPAPSYPQSPDQQLAEAPPPKSITQAVLLMRIGAVVSVVDVIAGLLTRNSLHDNIRQSLVDNQSYTASKLDTAYTAALVSLVVAGLVGVALWLWMAHANGNGRKWARIVATVLGGLSILNLVLAMAQSQASGLSLVLTVVTALLAVVILFLIWRRESSAFYVARSRPTYS